MSYLDKGVVRTPVEENPEILRELQRPLADPSEYGTVTIEIPGQEPRELPVQYTQRELEIVVPAIIDAQRVLQAASVDTSDRRKSLGVESYLEGGGSRMPTLEDLVDRESSLSGLFEAARASRRSSYAGFEGREQLQAAARAIREVPGKLHGLHIATAFAAQNLPKVPVGAGKR